MPTHTAPSDVDGFLPSPFDRYRQILLAVVQLIVAYGKQLPFGKSATAKQTLSFLMSLRDILSGVLHSAAVTPTTKRIELATLVIQTLRMALPAVSESETVCRSPRLERLQLTLGQLSSSAFGGLHMAALALFGSYLSDQGSLQMAPASQEEEAEMAMKAPSK